METGPGIISENTLVVTNIGMIIAFMGFYTKLLSDHIELKLTQKFQDKSLTAAHEKIRELEKKRNG